MGKQWLLVTRGNEEKAATPGMFGERCHTSRSGFCELYREKSSRTKTKIRAVNLPDDTLSAKQKRDDHKEE